MDGTHGETCKCAPVLMILGTGYHQLLQNILQLQCPQKVHLYLHTENTNHIKVLHPVDFFSLRLNMKDGGPVGCDYTQVLLRITIYQHHFHETYCHY